MSSDDEDDDYGSFFERTDFNFARANERLKAQNRIQLRTFQKESLRSDVVQGFIFIMVRTKLPEGKLFLRIENVANSNLLDRQDQEIPTKDEVLKKSVSKLQEKMKENAKNSVGKEDDRTDLQLVSVASKMSHKYLDQFGFKVEQSQLALISSKKMQHPSPDPASTFLQRNSDSQKKLNLVGMAKYLGMIVPTKYRTQKKVPLLVSEHEVFRIEKSLNRATTLVCKFTVKLETFTCVSCDQILVSDPGELPNYPPNGTIFQSQLLNLESLAPPQSVNNQQLNQQHRSHRSINSEIQPGAEQPDLTDERTAKGLEFVNIQTKITAFYVTNSTHAEFCNEPADKRLDKYRTGENFCESSADLVVLERLNLVDFHQWREKTQIFFCKHGGQARVIDNEELRIVPKPGVSLSVAKIEEDHKEAPTKMPLIPNLVKRRSASGLFSPSKIYENLDGVSPTGHPHHGAKGGGLKSSIGDPEHVPDSATKSGHRPSVSGISKLQLNPTPAISNQPKALKAESIVILPTTTISKPNFTKPKDNNMQCCDQVSTPIWGKIKNCFSKAIEYCSKPTPTQLPVEIMLDKRVFSKFDSTLTFVLKYPADLATRYTTLDIIIWKVRSIRECLPSHNQVYGIVDANNPSGEEGCKDEVCDKRLYNIIFHETVPIVRTDPVLTKMPQEAKGKNQHARTNRIERPSSKVEIVHQFSILELTKAYSSIDTSYFGLSFEIEFFLSPAPGQLELKVFSTALMFVNIPNDFVRLTRAQVSAYYNKIESDCNERYSDLVIWLPYAQIVSKEEFEKEQREAAQFEEDD